MTTRMGIALCLGAWLVLPLRGQQAARPEVPPASPYPAVAVEQARDAQRDFERIRRRHYERAGWGVDTCHEQVGRFCLNHDDDDDWVIPSDPPEVAAARQRLIATLDSVARVVSEDRWVLGQRVKYRLEAERVTEAIRLASECARPRWWCEALTGFALHEAGRSAEAEAAFEQALAALPADRRCAWTDLSLILERRDATRYRQLACGSSGRAAFERAFWHLSDPMWLTEGNERRAEHFSRRLRAIVEAEAATGYGLPWGRDLEELTLRYGWPAGWDVLWRRRPGSGTDRSIRAHRAPDAQHFAAGRLDRPAAEGGPEWALGEDRPRTTWTPIYGPVHDLPYQVAGFWRDEKRLIVGAFAAPKDLEGCPVRSGMFLANAFEELSRTEAAGTFPLTVAESGPPGSATLVGLEVRCREGGGAARVRAPLPATDKSLSDLLLLDSAARLPGTLDAALFHARRRSTARAGESIVVFWEWYGAAEPAETIAVTLSLTRRDESFWRKALDWTGLADRDVEEVGVRWSEPGGSESPARAVELRLPELAPGRYGLTLSVQSARFGAVSSARELVIVP